ncbi:MAG: hypothetical protein ACAH83_03505 [Alphaproteobacteria bacterium]
MKKLATPFALALICAGLLVSATAQAEIYFRDPDRVVLKEYVTAPSEQVTFYAPGTIIPETVTYTELPMTVTTRLMAPPSGSVYVSSGGNVYLLDKKKRRVIDAVQLY